MELIQATILVDLLAVAITLWMAFYLFARGFPSRVSLRVVIVLFSLSGFYYSAYYNIFDQVVGSAAWRAVFLTVGLASWFSLTFRLMPERNRQEYRWLEIGIYTLAVLACILLLQPNSFENEVGNALYVAHMSSGLPYVMYGFYQLIVSACILLNLLVGERIGLTSRGKYFLAASIFPTLSVLFGVISLRWSQPSPRLVQDLMIFCGVFILGLSVARHQTLIERRTSLQDFPLTALATLGITALTAFVALREDVALRKMAMVVGFVIMIVSAYDLTREYLERQRIRSEGAFRRRLRQLEGQLSDDDALQSRLQDGLDLLCDTLDASSGFIAIQRAGDFVVIATRASLPVETQIPSEMLLSEDVSKLNADQLTGVSWIAPAHEEQMQVAAIGMGAPNAKLDYSTGDLDLLAEVAEHVGKLVSLGKSNRVLALVDEPKSENTNLRSAADEMIASISTNPDAEFVKLVEDALRHFADYIALGQSPLVEWAGIQAESHVERGKQLQNFLVDAIDSFRPAGTRPPEPLPRVWYSYVVLYDAYVEGVPNREIMSRLYISEGTFNRTRRNALRGLARLTIERRKKALGNS